MTIKLYIEPNYSDVPDRGEGGIRRVTEAMCKYLPEFGIEITRDLKRADITNGHGVMRPLKPNTPFVSSCHGMYWHGYDWANWAHQVNAEVTEALISADAITAPSRWVAGALTRGIMRRPHVVYHGVDAGEWAHNEDNGGYVLWNKGRVDPVSDPADVVRLVSMMEDVQFVSTFGQNRDLPVPTGGTIKQYHNLKLIGSMPLPEMKCIIQRAGVYLCTARETFGIGTLEALAAGVPVVGWDYGGQSEIIRNGSTGMLVPFGDYDALVSAVVVVGRERARYSDNAITDARENWGWRPRIAQYAQIFHDVYNGRHATRPAVSIVVPCHNLARFLPECLDSVLRQPFKSWECIIVDDCSTDDTATVAREYEKRDGRFHYAHTGENLKLSRALTFGANLATGRYLVNLDADNLLPENSLSDCARELDNDPSLHIVYGYLDTISHDGANRARNPFPGAFDWRGQIAHLNQIHSSAMMRREVAIELGGWRERQWRAEDAEFWTRATSFGYRAKRITENPTLIYRVRSDSKGALEHRNDGGDGNWAAWFPFATAVSGRDGQIAMQEKRPIAKIDTVPFSAQGKLGIEKKFWPVFHHQAPLVSVIIPCSFEHRRYVIDALDSLMAQDFHDWEAIVVNTSEYDELKEIPGAPYARIFDTVPGKVEAGGARNYGAQQARGKLLYFLDADDYLLPGALREMAEAYSTGEDSYIYTNYVELWESWESGLEYFRWRFNFGGDKNAFKKFFRDNPDRVHYGAHDEKFTLANAEADTFGRLVHLDEYDQHNQRQAITNILIAKEDFESVGGFDHRLTSREDWDLLCKLSVNGKCGKRLAIPGFVYRIATGTRRNIGLEKQVELAAVIKRRYDKYYSGDGVTMSECCGPNSDAVLAAKRAVAFSYGDVEGMARYAPKPETLRAVTSGITPLNVRLEFTGTQAGSVPFMGKNGRQYRGANNVKNKYIDAHPEDVEKLVSTMQWRRVDSIIVGVDPARGDDFHVFSPPPIPTAPAEDEPLQAPIIDPAEIEKFNGKAGTTSPVPDGVIGIEYRGGEAVVNVKEDAPPEPVKKAKRKWKK